MDRPKRMPNFTPDEENVLKIITRKYQIEIENKVPNNKFGWETKKQIWLRIEKEFFDETQIARTHDKLRSKYEAMKKINKIIIPNIVKQEIAPTENAMKRKNVPKEEDVKENEAIKTSTKTEVDIDKVGTASNRLRNPLYERSTQIENIKFEPYKNICKEGIQIASANHLTRHLCAELNITISDDEDKSENNEVSQNTSPKRLMYDRNREIRVKEKHTLMMENLRLQNKILDLNLKIKEKKLELMSKN